MVDGLATWAVVLSIFLPESSGVFRLGLLPVGSVGYSGCGDVDKFVAVDLTTFDKTGR